MSSSHPSKQQILDLMRTAIREQGSAPGSKVFATRHGVAANQVKRYWPTHSALVNEAGGVPREAKRQLPEEDLFREYAKVCRHCGKIPTLTELRIATRELGTRTHKVQARFGGLGKFNERFKQWVLSAPGEYAEILDYPGWGRKPFGTGTRGTRRVDPIAADRYPYLPAGLLSLDTLASNRLPPGVDSDNSASLLFEQKCADAFRALGFQVRRLGQGKGRTTDCVALARTEGFGVIVDAKARSEGFVLGTEDRKLREYAKTYSDDLHRDGIERVYLCVVSSSFRDQDLEALRQALTGSGIHGWSLWPARILMTTVERSVAERWEFRLANLEQRFALNSIVTQQQLAVPGPRRWQ
jgi:hypothetical protein